MSADPQKQQDNKKSPRSPKGPTMGGRRWGSIMDEEMPLNRPATAEGSLPSPTEGGQDDPNRRRSSSGRGRGRGRGRGGGRGGPRNSDPATAVYGPTSTPMLYYAYPLDDSNLEMMKGLLRNQIQYYFSDSNLARDQYLRSYMNEFGWVPCEFLCSFNRILSITNDVSLLFQSVRESPMFEVEESMMLVRLKDTWTKWVEPPPNAEDDVAAEVRAVDLNDKTIPVTSPNMASVTPNVLNTWASVGGASVSASAGQDVFELDEEQDTSAPADSSTQAAPSTVDVLNEGEEEFDISQQEVSDENVRQLLIIAQSSRRPADTTDLEDKTVSELASMIENGLKVYENDIGTACGKSRLSSIENESVRAGLESRVYIPKYMKDGDGRKADGILRQLVGWVVGPHAVGGGLAPSPIIGTPVISSMALNQDKLSLGSAAVASSPVASSPLESRGSIANSFVISSFHHPSHEVLDRCGFVQFPYTKYRTMCLKERKRLGAGNAVDMDNLYHFWCRFLFHRWNERMYHDLKVFAIEDANVGERNGLNSLFRFLSEIVKHCLEQKLSIRKEIWSDFQDLAVQDFNNGSVYGLKQFCLFKWELPTDQTAALPTIKKELKDIMKHYESPSDFA